MMEKAFSNSGGLQVILEALFQKSLNVLLQS